ncbi:MAG: DUF2520 domain-containing protein [Bacteroidetes bacterium]|nr:DUF2520 domain-containing protein [Bacteroidota bacterium]
MSIIGAGKVGTSIGILFYNNGFSIASVISRTKRSAESLARSVRCTRYSTTVKDLHPNTGILVFAVPDSVLETLVREVAWTSKRVRYAFHTSGAMLSDVLTPLKKSGCIIFSLHPIQTFPTILTLEEQLKALHGITYGFEGPPESFSFARSIVTMFGGSILRIPKEKKILYHTACVFASNYPVVLLGIVENLLASVSKKATLKNLKPLIEASIHNALRLGPSSALTGPVVRCDAQTIVKHLRAIGSEKTRRKSTLYKLCTICGGTGSKVEETIIKTRNVTHEGSTRNRR